MPVAYWLEGWPEAYRLPPDWVWRTLPWEPMPLGTVRPPVLIRCSTAVMGSSFPRQMAAPAVAWDHQPAERPAVPRRDRE